MAASVVRDLASEGQNELPQRAVDRSVDSAIQPRAALVYRLSGDYNPCMPNSAAVARAAISGATYFARTATYGIAGWPSPKKRVRW